MKPRILICIAAVLCALGASSAQAVQPSGPAPTRTLSGGVGFGSSEAGPLPCESSEGTGALTGATTGTMTLTLKGCTNYRGTSCGNVGEGEIQSEPLIAETGWVAPGEVGEVFRPESGNVWMRFNCPASDTSLAPIVISGGVIGVVRTLNAMTEEQTVTLTAEADRNMPESLEGDAPTGFSGYAPWLLEGRTWPATLELTWTVTTTPVEAGHGAALARTAGTHQRKVKDPVELRALPGQQPEHGRCQRQAHGLYGSAGCTTLHVKRSHTPHYEWHPIA